MGQQCVVSLTKTHADKSSCFHRAGAPRGVLPPLITGVAIVLIGIAGIARMLGWGPNLADDSGDILALDQKAPVSATSEARVGARCPECGVIVSIREIQASGGTVAGSRSETRAKATRSYEITVRLADGSSRVFNDASSANWRSGERVIVIDGANRPN